MNKIMDYEQMLEFLNNLDKEIIKKQKPIGKSNFNEPILHYTYGHGEEHIILSAGIHSAELITNIFLLKLMKRLSDKQLVINPEKYTIHFIPINNPDGTIITTSAIRSLIPRKTNYLEEQLILLQYYLNSRTDDYHAINKCDKDNKLIHMMFKYLTPDCISDKYQALKENVKNILSTNNLSNSILINWNSNGYGVDLNANIECGEYLEKYKSNDTLYATLRLNQINRFTQGPIGCPSREKDFFEEPETTAIINFYKDLIKKHKVIGSVIYHSSGAVVYYLDYVKERNFWNPSYNYREINYNKEVAKTYANVTDYKTDSITTHTTLCAKLRTYLPGSLVVELSNLRSTPLSQFINLDFSNYTDNLDGELSKLSNNYDNTINSNINALLKTIETMSQEYEKYCYGILVNANNQCPNNEHFEIIDCHSQYGEERKLEKITFHNWQIFQQQAKKDGFHIEIESGYRSKEFQQEIWDEFLAEKGEKYTKKYVAKPGYSEHQTGLAIDICLEEDGIYLCDTELIDHKIVKYIENNAYKFGFILRYPKGKENITGYNYEPWHIRYVGTPLATEITKQGITLEEYHENLQRK